LSLGLTSRSMQDVVMTDDVWRPQCRALFREHRHPAADASYEGQLFGSGEAGQWLALWQQLLGRYRRYLGAAARLALRGWR
jgi:hypothetical protein